MAAWWSVSTNFYVSLLALLRTECCISAFFARVVAHSVLSICKTCCTTTQSVFEKTNFSVCHSLLAKLLGPVFRVE